MKAKDSLRMLAGITADQWGMVTSAQAIARGVTRLNLSRLADAGHLARLSHGVYLDAGAPRTPFDDVRAAWLSTEPKVMGDARISDLTNCVVVAGGSAAQLYGIGDLWADRHDFIYPRRRQSQRKEIRYRQRVLETRDVTLIRGLPTMTIERTIADLVEDVADLSLVADALRDASLKRPLSFDRLQDLLAPLAERHGFHKGDGAALLGRLLEIAGLDLDTVAHQVVADESLSSRVVATYLGNLSREHLHALVATPEMQTTIRVLQESMAATLRGTVPSLAVAPAVMLKAAQSRFSAHTDIGEVAVKLSEELTSREVMVRLIRSWTKPPIGMTKSMQETQAAIRAAHGRVDDDRQ